MKIIRFFSLILIENIDSVWWSWGSIYKCNARGKPVGPGSLLQPVNSGAELRSSGLWVNTKLYHCPLSLICYQYIAATFMHLCIGVTSVDLKRWFPRTQILAVVKGRGQWYLPLIHVWQAFTGVQNLMLPWHWVGLGREGHH